MRRLEMQGEHTLILVAHGPNAAELLLYLSDVLSTDVASKQREPQFNNTSAETYTQQRTTELPVGQELGAGMVLIARSVLGVTGTHMPSRKVLENELQIFEVTMPEKTRWIVRLRRTTGFQLLQQGAARWLTSRCPSRIETHPPYLGQ